MNYALIAVNVVIFLLSMQPVTNQQTGKAFFLLREWAQPFTLLPEHPAIWQFVTYAFLHGGLMHIFGNMFFLFMFGNNVNDKLGHVGYLCLYLAGAVFSGIGHSLLHMNPVLGASGAVAAVTGAYLALFPNTLITVVYWLFFIGTTEIRALYFIAFKLIVYDNMIEPRFTTTNIAYEAHLAGYAFGIIAITGLLSIGLIQGNHSDLWYLLRQWNRRRRFRDAVSDGYDPYRGNAHRKTVASRVEDAPVDPQQEQIISLRSQIGQAMNSRNAGRAAALYLELQKIDSSQTLPLQLQLDIANQLMAEGQWEPSGLAYQKFLARYSNYEHAEQVHLMLGLDYGRYLDRPQEALEHLRQAEAQLKDPSQKTMCRQEIDRLSGTG